MEDNKTALVTGAAKGIGAAIAVKLAQDGYLIAVMDILESGRAEGTMERIRHAGARALYIQADISSESDRRKAADSVMDTFGRIDILVNNAGVAPRNREDILSTSVDSFDFVMDINLKGTFFMTQAVAGIMVREKEKIHDYYPVIVNISSISAYTSSVYRGEYCISKAGVSMITRLFADRLAEYGINVYEIRPGIILTDMTSGVKEKYDRLINGGLTPIKRWGKPGDIADAVSVLCSGRLGFSTGEVINVDGGFHLRRL